MTETITILPPNKQTSFPYFFSFVFSTISIRKILVLFLPLTVNDTNVEAGESVTITNATVSLNFSRRSCDDLQFLCARILRGMNPSPDFTITTGYIACTPVDCRGVRLLDVIVRESFEPSGFPLRELVNGSQTVRLDVTLIPDPAAGGISGMDLWNIDVFFSNSSNCPAEPQHPARVDLTTDHDNLPITPGQNAAFAGINVSRTICYRSFPSIFTNERMMNFCLMYRGSDENDIIMVKRFELQMQYIHAVEKIFPFARSFFVCISFFT